MVVAVNVLSAVHNYGSKGIESWVGFKILGIFIDG